MSDHFEITTPSKVPSFSQLAGTYQKFISCFPTSMAMCIKHCLNILGQDKSIIGCGPDTYLEDYVNMLLEDAETIKWMKTNNVKYGGSFIPYLNAKKQRMLYDVETYLFNRLMNEHGFKATFVIASYAKFCETIERTNLPIIVGGDFSSVSKVGGHMNVMAGYNQKGLSELICNDPYGSALKGYPWSDDPEQMKAEYIRYPVKFFYRDKALNIYGVVIEQA